jgi:hypothetical protein
MGSRGAGNVHFMHLRMAQTLDLDFSTCFHSGEHGLNAVRNERSSGTGLLALELAFFHLSAARWETSVANALTRDSVASPLPNKAAFPAIFAGGLIVGVLDLAYAIVLYSPHKPILIPQTIASGVLGMRSYSGGAQTAALGVLLHFVIALSAATVYYLASRHLPFLIRHAVLCGLIYGALVYLFMHLVVLPLSAAPHGHMPFLYKAAEFVEHWFCVGLPIALSVRHYSS